VLKVAIKIDWKEKSNKVLINFEDLFLFFNELVLDSRGNFLDPIERKFGIIDCLYGNHLYDIVIGDKIKITVKIPFNEYPEAHHQQEYFINKSKKYRDIYPRVFKDFPDSLQIREAILNSGILFKYYQDGFDKILEELKDINFLEGDLPIALAFDTSTYRNQVFSQLYLYLMNNYRLSPKSINFLLSEGVKAELMNFEDKYRQKDINNLKTVGKYPQIIDRFINQNMLEARLIHSGHTDYLKSRKFTNTKQIPEGYARDQDTRIIRGLAKYVEKNNIKLHLFSHDKDFNDRAQGFPNVKSHILEKNLPLRNLGSNFECSWEIFFRLLYNLSILFGAIILRVKNKHEIIIFGIWVGKSASDWENERLLIYSENSILKNIKKELNLLYNVIL